MGGSRDGGHHSDCNDRASRKSHADKEGVGKGNGDVDGGGNKKPEDEDR